MIDTRLYKTRKIHSLESYSIHNMEILYIPLPPIELQLANNNDGYTFSFQAGSKKKCVVFVFYLDPITYFLPGVLMEKDLDV